MKECVPVLALARGRGDEDEGNVGLLGVAGHVGIGGVGGEDTNPLA